MAQAMVLLLIARLLRAFGLPAIGLGPCGCREHLHGPLAL